MSKLVSEYEKDDTRKHYTMHEELEILRSLDVTQEAAAQEVAQAAAAQTAAATQDASARRTLARHPSIDDVMQSLDVGGTDAGAGPADVAQVLASGIDAMFVGEEITYTNTMCVCTYRIVLI